MSAATVERVVSRRVRIAAGHTRSVLGGDLAAGDLLPTGLILEVTRNDIDGETRLEMIGANIHYVAYDEPVTVLASVDRDVLDAISVGTFVARATEHARPPRTRATPPLDAVAAPPESAPKPVVHEVPETDRRAKHNRGRMGNYAPDVEHYTDICPVHGKTTFARHRIGKTRTGEQRYKRRCLTCHSDYNLDHLD